jgi:hypothetical protein
VVPTQTRRALTNAWSWVADELGIDSLLADPPITARARRKAKCELPTSVRRAYRRRESRRADAQNQPDEHTQNTAWL